MNENEMKFSLDPTYDPFAILAKFEIFCNTLYKQGMDVEWMWILHKIANKWFADCYHVPHVTERDMKCKSQVWIVTGPQM